MTGDFTSVPLRASDPWTGARLQQGRVLLDGDWNLNLDAAAREGQQLALDAIGPAGVPQGSAGFEISFASDRTLQIGAGSMWVGGLHAVNPATLAYSAQEAIAALPGSGQALLYLDAFVQEVQAAEDPGELLDPALDGVDTTTRAASCPTACCGLRCSTPGPRRPPASPGPTRTAQRRSRPRSPAPVSRWPRRRRSRSSRTTSSR